MTQTSASPTPIRSEEPKRQTAKEAIAANIQSLIEQLEAGDSEAFTAYLNAMSRFHKHSFGNIPEIARQKPDATRMADLYAWNQLGRKVKKGERGIRILAAIVGVRRKPEGEAEKDIRKQNRPVLVGFRNAYVFERLSRRPKAQSCRRCARSLAMWARIAAACCYSSSGGGSSSTLRKKIAPALGTSYCGRIAILSGQSKAEEFSTIVHELAHQMLHKAERRTATTRLCGKARPRPSRL